MAGRPKVSRRGFLFLAVIGSGVAVGVAGRELQAGLAGGDGSGSLGDSAPFRGVRQAGIVSSQQQHVCFAGFDVAAAGVEDLRSLLRVWTGASARLTAGEAFVGREGASADSGEVVGLGAAGLTLTFGFGPGLFVAGGGAAFGLDARRPDALVDLPVFRGDRLDPGYSGGDLCVQACAEDPQVALHAVRSLVALGRGVAAVRWLQRGFRSRAPEGGLGRNLFGFRDGTNNLDPADEERMAANVWVGPEDEPGWMRGGTYMVVRRIRMRLEHWDSVSLEEQERTFGRHKLSGAPLGGEAESDPVDPARLPPDCHVLQANPRTEGSEAERILRRSYSFADGIDERFGELDAGLFFVCFQRDPRRQFVPIQRRLAENDHLSEYVVHTGSAIFAIPPGVREGGYIGETLLEGV